MQIKEISITGFKAINDASFEPGSINVLIGANGSGKSTFLEAIGLLSAAMTDRIDESILDRKGIRLSTATLYKSSFRGFAKQKTIGLSVTWDDDGIFKYAVNLNTPNDNESAWRYHSEALFRNSDKLWGRSGRSKEDYDNRVGMLMLEPNSKLIEIRPTVDVFRNYAIYQPSTPALRGVVPDKYQTNPLGLNGGRLAETIEEIITKKDGESKFGLLDFDEVLELIDWAADFSVTVPKKSSINASVPTSRRVIEFQDTFMRDSDKFTAYDASEGSLYVLFLLCLAMHPKAPKIFAIDNFDQAMNPRLARATTKLFCRLIKDQGKTVFITTHNPLVLDGLDLNDTAIRLFTIERSRKNGDAQIKRIEINNELLEKDQPLSRLWIDGRLGGVPNLL